MEVTAEYDTRALIENIIYEGYSSLARSLQWFYPAKMSSNGKYVNNLSESLFVTNLASAFIQNKFYAYTEVQYNDNCNSNKRIDLVALDPYRQILVMLEAKTNYESPDGILQDYERLKCGNILRCNRHIREGLYDFSGYTIFKVLSFASLDVAIRNWWIQFYKMDSKDIIPLNRQKAKKAKTTESWSKLGRILKDESLSTFDFPLHVRYPLYYQENNTEFGNEFDQSESPQYTTWFALCAIFQ